MELSRAARERESGAGLAEKAGPILFLEALSLPATHADQDIVLRDDWKQIRITM